ncbi:hypothetical protein H920_19454 [Fukomys damarensis]|uniref:Uncharacterized protein n=1 Tax=Fukomys damarensis TaxID=885580 RepID=A0A091CPN1_FUKDA|nr:hypothetical protein H920_19454 [Fukomys damarensis]
MCGYASLRTREKLPPLHLSGDVEKAVVEKKRKFRTCWQDPDVAARDTPRLKLLKSDFHSLCKSRSHAVRSFVFKGT